MSKRLDDHANYWTAKKAKLAEQFAESKGSLIGSDSSLPIFAGVHLYVNGYTVPSAEVLKNLIVKHGGVYTVFIDSSITHMVANNLPDSKMKLLKKIKVVKPEWVTDSIEKGRQLPCADYLTVNPLKEQGKILLRKRTENSNCGGQLNEDKCESDSSHLGESSKNPDEDSETSTKVGNGPLLGADVDSFHNKSRLHFLSTMKVELKTYVSNLRKEGKLPFEGLKKLKNWLKEKYEKTDSSKWQRETDYTHSEPPPKVIMHLDMDCFFVSVSRCGRPDLEGLPVVVTSSKLQGPQYRNLDSKADIACCSYEARAAGVRNGMTVGKALLICPNLVAVPYDFKKYRTVSQKLYEIASSYTIALEAVSCDEMYIDCTSIVMETDSSPVDFAEHIRKEIMEHTGCCASAGIGGNHILARLATRKAKPNGIFYLEQEMLEQFIKDVPLHDLPGIGPSLSSKLNELNLHICGQLQTWELSKLEKMFGVQTGKKLYNSCRGLESVTHKEGNTEERKSVSSEINYGIRFTKFVEAEETLNNLSRIVSSKLADLKGKCVTLKLKVRSPNAPVTSAKFLGHGICDSICRASTLDLPSSDPDVISKVAVELLRKSNILISDIRGLGIMVTKLEKGSSNQKTESIAQYFKRPNLEQVAVPKERVENTPLAVQILRTKKETQKETDNRSLCLGRAITDKSVEEMDLIKLVQSYFDSYVDARRLPDRQFKNTVLCILLSEVAELNVAPALNSLRELSRLIHTKIPESLDRKPWTTLLTKISRRVHKEVSEIVGHTLSDFDTDKKYLY